MGGALARPLDPTRARGVPIKVHMPSGQGPSVRAATPRFFYVCLKSDDTALSQLNNVELGRYLPGGAATIEVRRK